MFAGETNNKNKSSWSGSGSGSEGKSDEEGGGNGTSRREASIGERPSVSPPVEESCDKSSAVAQAAGVVKGVDAIPSLKCS